MGVEKEVGGLGSDTRGGCWDYHLLRVRLGFLGRAPPTNAALKAVSRWLFFAGQMVSVPLLEGGLLEGLVEVGWSPLPTLQSLLNLGTPCLPTTPAYATLILIQSQVVPRVCHNLLPFSSYCTQLLTAQMQVLHLRKLKLGKVKHLAKVKQQVTRT